jgi:hypothetical protein
MKKFSNRFTDYSFFDFVFMIKQEIESYNVNIYIYTEKLCVDCHIEISVMIIIESIFSI